MRRRLEPPFYGQARGATIPEVNAPPVIAATSPATCPLCARPEPVHFHSMEPPIPWHLYAPGLSRANGLRFFRCLACHLIWKDPQIRPTPAQERIHYEKHNNDVREPGYRAHLMELLGPVAQIVREGAKGLDYGSGPAPSLEPLARELKLDCSSFDPFFAPSYELLAEEAYDFIFCCEVVEHFREPQKEFAKLAQLLKPGGVVGIKTQIPPEDFSAWWYHRDPTHVSFFSRQTFQAFAGLFRLVPVLTSSGVVILRHDRPS